MVDQEGRRISRNLLRQLEPAFRRYNRMVSQLCEAHLNVIRHYIAQ